MALNTRGGVGKPQHKRSGKTSGKPTGKPSSTSSSSSRPKKSSNLPKPKPVQQKSKPQTSAKSQKKKPPHLRYSESQLNVPKLNGILPTGVQKAARAKKGKNFVDDREGMNTILALVMAEKEGNIESKMMRSRQLEEVREARKAEAEKRAQSKKAGLEERKQDIKDEKKSRKRGVSEGAKSEMVDAGKKKFNKKRVSFG